MPERVPDQKKKAKPDSIAGHRSDDAIRVIFIPWTAAEDEEWAAKSAQWNDMAQKNGKRADRFTIIHYDPGKKHPVLQAIGDGEHPDAVVYMRGHGSPGAPYIQMRSKANEPKSNIFIDEACQRLLDSGLGKKFNGVIKFYSCYSGTKLSKTSREDEKKKAASANKDFKQALKDKLITDEQYEAWWKSPPSKDSVGKAGAEFLRKKGFKGIFYGYLGPLSSEYTDDNADWKDDVSGGGKAAVKSVVLDENLVVRPEELDGKKYVRASSGRVQV